MIFELFIHYSSPSSTLVYLSCATKQIYSTSVHDSQRKKWQPVERGSELLGTVQRLRSSSGTNVTEGLSVMWGDVPLNNEEIDVYSIQGQKIKKMRGRSSEINEAFFMRHNKLAKWI